MRRDRVRATLSVAAHAAMVWSVVMVLLGTDAIVTRGETAAAADGPQAAPSIEPTSVATAAHAFTVRPPADARCQEDGTGSGADNSPGPRTGADNWRWHSFIVEEGRDLASLRFGPYGPGDDFDASDGTITAGLIVGGGGVWEKIPALKPEGLIIPNDLGGVSLDPGTYMLRDGMYLIGFACTDDTLATRQWWSIPVMIQTKVEPFLTVVGNGAGSSGPAAPSRAETSPPTTADAGVASASDGQPQGVQLASSDAVVAAPTSTTDDAPLAPTGVSWAPLVALQNASTRLPTVGWAVLVGVFTRIAYLLARPVRVLAPLAL